MIDIPSLSSNPRSRAAPHTRFTKEHDFLIQRRFREAEPILKLFFGKKQGIRMRCDRKVDSGGDAICFVLVRLADVNEEARVGGCFEDIEDLVRVDLVLHTDRIGRS